MLFWLGQQKAKKLYYIHFININFSIYYYRQDILICSIKLKMLCLEGSWSIRSLLTIVKYILPVVNLLIWGHLNSFYTANEIKQKSSQLYLLIWNTDLAITWMLKWSRIPISSSFLVETTAPSYEKHKMIRLFLGQ